MYIGILLQICSMNN